MIRPESVRRETEGKKVWKMDYQKEETFMKQKTHRLLSLLLCLVMVLGLLPMTAFAEDTRTEVDTIKATAIINVPSYGEPTNYP